MKMTTDDPKLTAYALGELDPADRLEVEALLAESAEARQAVEDIRQTAAQLEHELKTEPCPRLSDVQRERLESELHSSQEDELAHRRSKPQREPPFAAWFSWLARAAAVLLVLGMVGFLMMPSLTKQNARSQADRKAANPAVNQPMFDQTYAEHYAVNAPPDLAPGFNTEAYDRIVDNPFRKVTDHPLSTFSIDVDTASYANVRRFLSLGQRPPKDAVRIEEMINYFTYDYPPPLGGHPFSVNVEVAACPWNLEHRLVRVGLKGREIATDKRPPSNLVFLLDVSGSMQAPNKLELVKQALRLLVEQLTENDRVSMVVYAGASGVVLPPTSGHNKGAILATLDRLQAGGSTHGSAGLQLAYEQAASHFIRGGVNRVILCTDGDFNVGITSQGDLTRLIEQKAKSGVYLSVLGFGMGNLKDSTMEKLADKGNGNYAYIDTLAEARKVLVEQMSGTLITIAKDVKIQVEFNPARVAAYRLIGYENRLLHKEDFNDDTKDAGEIGAGHTVTALYELVPAGQSVGVPSVDPLKYQTPPQPAAPAQSDELLHVKVRYKAPEGDTSQLIETPVRDGGLTYPQASPDFKFAAAVAGFGMVLRDSPYKGSANLEAVIELAEAGKGRDPGGYRAEFLELVNLTKQLGR
jgi:Ca-activated chloride channel family protein